MHTKPIDTLALHSKLPLPKPIEMKRSVDEFYDSSDDEAIVEVNPYEGITLIDSQKVAENLTIKRLRNIRAQSEILNKAPQAHQDLIKKNAIEGPFNPVTLKHGTSNFVAPLRDPAQLLDALPSRPNLQANLINSVVPSFSKVNAVWFIQNAPFI